MKNLILPILVYIGTIFSHTASGAECKDADLVLLNGNIYTGLSEKLIPASIAIKDIMTIEEDKIMSAQVVMTVVDGKVVFERK